MRWLSVALCLALGVVSGQVVEGRFIVELDGETARPEPVRKLNARRAIEGRSGQVLHSFERVLDGFVVQAPHLTAADLEALPGVRKVYPVVTGTLHLDTALNVNNIIGAWVRLGAWELAGQGMKIAILDSGIDQTHPGFRDDGLPVPDGYPRGNRESDLAGTNNKVIVARSYEDLLPGVAEATTRDRVGHGTAVAMVAAGVPHQSPIGIVSGAAPKAYLGSYKIFGGPADTTTSDILIRALDDAVKDGMDVINLSAGFTPVARPEDDPMVQAVDRAVALGVVVVQSAGNLGPEPASTSSPGQSETVLLAGAQPNGRVLIATVTVGDEMIVPALAATIRPPEPVTGTIGDVAGVDGTGLACEALPSDSLAGRIALILRGDCEFRTKLNHVQAAGALAAVIYTNQNPGGTWDPQDATLPALMISHAAGQAIQGRAAESPGLTLTLRFENGAFPVDSQRVSDFSSRGPSVSGRIQPDLLAVGEFIYTAVPRNGAETESRNQYRVVDGTSFSAPLVAGSAAVLKSVRPNLQVGQYRSLLSNTASPVVVDGNPVPVLSAGAGSLNLEAGLLASATAVPSSLTFGAGGGSVEIFRQLTITNIGKQVETYVLAAHPRRGPAPTFTDNTFTLEPGAERWVLLAFAGTDLAPGHHEGTISVQGSGGGAALRVPYWYGVRTDAAASISLVNRPRAAVAAGSQVRFYAKVLDAIGMPLSTQPEVAVQGEHGEVVAVRSVDRIFPGLWSIDVRLAATRGLNTFLVTVGEVVREVTVTGQ